MTELGRAGGPVALVEPMDLPAAGYCPLAEFRGWAAACVAEPGLSAGREAMLAATVLYAKPHAANRSCGDKAKLELALRLGDLLASQSEADTAANKQDYEWDIHFWLDAMRLLDTEQHDVAMRGRQLQPLHAFERGVRDARDVHGPMREIGGRAMRGEGPRDQQRRHRREREHARRSARRTPDPFEQGREQQREPGDAEVVQPRLHRRLDGGNAAVQR